MGVGGKGCTPTSVCCLPQFGATPLEHAKRNQSRDWEAVAIFLEECILYSLEG